MYLQVKLLSNPMVHKMFKFLSVIPRQIWIAIGCFFFGVMLVLTAYNKGQEFERVKWKLKLEEQINLQVSERLLEVNRDLVRALEFKEEKDKIIRDLDKKLNASESQSKDLQERLRNVLSNPTTTCPSLPDDEYGLYYDITSQNPK